MSNAALTAVFQHSASKGVQRLVLIAITDEASTGGYLMSHRRSRSYLASKANVPPRSVTRAIGDLVELGEIEVIAIGDGRESSDYRIHLPGLDEGPTVDRNNHPIKPARGDEVTPPNRTGGDEVTPVGVSRRHRRGDKVTPPSSPSLPLDPLTRAPSTSEQKAEERFERLWGVYPKRDGKRVGKAAAKRVWMRMSPEEHLAAWTGVHNYAKSGWRPKDAERWLRDRLWEDWQDPATPDPVGPQTESRLTVGRPDYPFNRDRAEYEREMAERSKARAQ